MTNPVALSTFGFLAAVIVTFADGRRAVFIAAIAVSLGLAPTAAYVGGTPAVLLLLATVVAALVLSGVTVLLARSVPRRSGLDPLVPIFSPKTGLFGPRSIRAAATVVALPVASWISFNVPVGSAASVAGLTFAAAYIWLCGAARLLVARTLEDLGVAIVSISLASATSVLVRGDANAIKEAAFVCALVPLVGITITWLGGRHDLRPKRGES